MGFGVRGFWNSGLTGFKSQRDVRQVFELVGLHHAKIGVHGVVAPSGDGSELWGKELGSRIWDSEIQSFGFQVMGIGFKDWGLEFGVWGLGFGV